MKKLLRFKPGNYAPKTNQALSYSIRYPCFNYLWIEKNS